MKWFALLMITTLIGCNNDETLSGYIGDFSKFQLVTIDGRSFGASAILDLSETGKVSGSAPCNSYSAIQTAPYPWFDVGPILTTRKACPDLEEETAFLNALATVTLAEVSARTLLLSNTDGLELLFQAVP